MTEPFSTSDNPVRKLAGQLFKERRSSQCAFVQFCGSELNMIAQIHGSIN